MRAFSRALTLTRSYVFLGGSMSLARTFTSTFVLRLVATTAFVGLLMGCLLAAAFVLGFVARVAFVGFLMGLLLWGT